MRLGLYRPSWSRAAPATIRPCRTPRPVESLSEVAPQTHSGGGEHESRGRRRSRCPTHGPRRRRPQRFDRDDPEVEALGLGRRLGRRRLRLRRAGREVVAMTRRARRRDSRRDPTPVGECCGWKTLHRAVASAHRRPHDGCPTWPGGDARVRARAAGSALAGLLAAVAAALASVSGTAPPGAAGHRHATGGPAGLAVSDGRIWVAAPGAGAVLRCSTPTYAPGRAAAAHRRCAGAACAGRAVCGWPTRPPRRHPGAGATASGVRPIRPGADATISYSRPVRSGSRARPTGVSTRSSPGMVPAALPSGRSPVALAADARRVVAADARGGTLTTFDARTPQRRPAARPGRRRTGRRRARGRHAWVADAAGGRIVAVDLSAGGSPKRRGRRPSGRARHRRRRCLRAVRGGPPVRVRDGKVRSRRGGRRPARRARRRRAHVWVAAPTPTNCCDSSADAPFHPRRGALLRARLLGGLLAPAVDPAQAPARYRFVPPREPAFDFQLHDQDGTPSRSRRRGGRSSRSRSCLHLPRPLPGGGEPDRLGDRSVGDGVLVYSVSVDPTATRRSGRARSSSAAPWTRARSSSCSAIARSSPRSGAPTASRRSTRRPRRRSPPPRPRTPSSRRRPTTARRAARTRRRSATPRTPSRIRTRTPPPQLPRPCTPRRGSTSNTRHT